MLRRSGDVLMPRQRWTLYRAGGLLPRRCRLSRQLSVLPWKPVRQLHELVSLTPLPGKRPVNHTLFVRRRSTRWSEAALSSESRHARTLCGCSSRSRCGGSRCLASTSSCPRATPRSARSRRGSNRPADHVSFDVATRLGHPLIRIAESLLCYAITSVLLARRRRRCVTMTPSGARPIRRRQPEPLPPSIRTLDRKEIRWQLPKSHRRHKVGFTGRVLCNRSPFSGYKTDFRQ